MGRPTLVVVSGPAAAGKTSLAHKLAVAIGCPVVCRDEIKEGMVQAAGKDFQAAPGDPLTQRTLSVFFDVIRLLLEAGVTLVAEAAFQDHVWRPRLEELSDLANIRVVRCQVNHEVGRQRLAVRGRRAAHADSSVTEDAEYFDRYTPISLAVPTIDVDSSSGYEPSLEEIVAFAQEA